MFFSFLSIVFFVCTGDKISGYSLLRPFQSKQGRQPVKIQSDGNCLFRAISVALTGSRAYNLQLRQVIAAFEANEQHVLNGLHETINTSKFVDHIKSISQNGVWGTNVEIIAAATLFKMDVYVATDSYKPRAAVWLKYTPYLKVKTLPDIPSATIPVLSGRTGKWIEIVHKNNNHFDAIKTIKIETLCRPIL